MRRTRAHISIGLLATALLVGGCGSDEPEAPTTTAEAPQELEPEDVEPTDEPTTRTPEPGPPGSEDIAEPGTTLEVGESAVIHVQSGAEEFDYYAYYVVETTVTGIVEGDAAILAQLENAEDLAGYTPYFIVLEHEIISTTGQTNTSMTPTVVGLLADGTEAGGAVSVDGALSDACPTEVYEEHVVGAVARTCRIALGEPGNPVTGAAWRGDDYADGTLDENPYADDPVTWTW